MKAAILHQFGEAPRYEDFATPTPREKDNALILSMPPLASSKRTREACVGALIWLQAC
jgi:hypothetical protein